MGEKTVYKTYLKFSNVNTRVLRIDFVDLISYFFRKIPFCVWKGMLRKEAKVQALRDRYDDT